MTTDDKHSATPYISLPLKMYKRIYDGRYEEFGDLPEQVIFAIINLDLDIKCSFPRTTKEDTSNPDIETGIVKVYIDDDAYKAFEALAEAEGKSIEDTFADKIKSNLRHARMRGITHRMVMESIYDDIDKELESEEAKKITMTDDKDNLPPIEYISIPLTEYQRLLITAQMLKARPEAVLRHILRHDMDATSCAKLFIEIPPNKSTSEVVNICVNQACYAELKAEAINKGKSISDLVIDGIRYSTPNEDFRTWFAGWLLWSTYYDS